MCIANERGELRSFVLCASKAHSAFVPALFAIKESLNLYGHTQPHLAFTDNVAADKPVVTSVFKSLTKNVVPISKYGKLERFQLSSSTAVIVLNTADRVEAVLRSIISEIDPNSLESTQVVGFDIEWNVRMDVNERGHILSSAPSKENALMQIAWKSKVYLIRVSFLPV